MIHVSATLSGIRVDGSPLGVKCLGDSLLGYGCIEMSGDASLVALLAEEPAAHIAEPLPPLERVVTDRYCVNLGATPTETVVQRVRCLEASLPDVIAEVRSLIRDRGHYQAIWFVGPSTRPSDMVAHLRQEGYVPTTTPPWEPTYAAMIMTTPPSPPADRRISARRVETLEDLIAGIRIDAASTGLSDDELNAMLGAAPDLFEVERRDGRLTFLAFDETHAPIALAWPCRRRSGWSSPQPRRFRITADAAHTERSYTLDGRRRSDAEPRPSPFKQEQTHDRSWNASASTPSAHCMRSPTRQHLATTRSESKHSEHLAIAPSDRNECSKLEAVHIGTPAHAPLGRHHSPHSQRRHRIARKRLRAR